MGNKLIRGVNDLETLFPDIAKQWNANLNGNLTPKDINSKSCKKIWWTCENNHIYQTQVANRTNLKTGCPYCSGRLPIVGETDLETVYPEVAKEWNYKKNGNLTPKMVTKASSKKVWWICKEGHEWESTIHERSRQECGCPYCSNHRVLVGWNDLESSGYSCVDEWAYDLNGDLAPSMVTKNSSTKVWWRCKQGHTWETKVLHRTYDGSNCPYCSNFLLLSGFNDLATKFPGIMQEWAYDLNKDIGPTKIAPSEKRTVWWRCQLGHEWKASPSNRSSKNTGCPYCSNKKILKGFNDFKTVCPDIAKEWAYDLNGNIQPDLFSFRSGRKVWWRCELGHTWESTIDNRVHGRRCPYCVGKKVLEGFNDLATTHPHLAEEWSDKNKNLNPRMVVAGSNKKVWWECREGHTWKTVINSRTLNGNGCPICSGRYNVSMPELVIYYYVKQFFPNAVRGDRTYGREIDIYIPSIHKGIEYDGVKYHSEDRQVENDLYKNNLFRENNIEILHVRENGCPDLSELRCIWRSDNSSAQSLAEVIAWIFKNFLFCDFIPNENEVKKIMRQVKLEMQQKVEQQLI